MPAKYTALTFPMSVRRLSSREYSRYPTEDGWTHPYTEQPSLSDIESDAVSVSGVIAGSISVKHLC
ncbi:uncharacterized protein PHALS_07159 [Plasmopara halstedii]|uniref:Uncharacterized protein n=1 Tax=Plasmopara halstedii TaxID=4781 RepID=A0A0P1B4S5_PLAHL|nr:uncharacterized protein PHALS_07159 [Plasmopara halstedii]CEG49394.1 hypothetical protein PHALS_07159 [Plasmopara halstedii]|eukprot:XP_024585763.1 hypothetical protein PHALS_07159 [Plasmopara halstedii]